MRAGRRDVPLTHPDKVLFPDDGITKADLAAYYRDAAPRMVDLVRDRPVSLQRFNAGIGKPGFFQKNVERGAPDWVKRVQVGKRGGSLWHVLANDARDARVAGQPELHHAARLALARGPPRSARTG